MFDFIVLYIFNNVSTIEKNQSTIKLDLYTYNFLLSSRFSNSFSSCLHAMNIYTDNIIQYNIFIYNI